jgi:hypothetical protein
MLLRPEGLFPSRRRQAGAARRRRRGGQPGAGGGMSEQMAAPVLRTVGLTKAVRRPGRRQERRLRGAGRLDHESHRAQRGGQDDALQRRRRPLRADGGHIEFLGRRVIASTRTRLARADLVGPAGLPAWASPTSDRRWRSARGLVQIAHPGRPRALIATLDHAVIRPAWYGRFLVHLGIFKTRHPTTWSRPDSAGPSRTSASSPT